MEIAEVILIGEIPPRDLRPRRLPPHELDLLVIQRPVKGQEMDVLVFAHGTLSLSLSRFEQQPRFVRQVEPSQMPPENAALVCLRHNPKTVLPFTHPVVPHFAGPSTLKSH